MKVENIVRIVWPRIHPFSALPYRPYSIGWPPPIDRTLQLFVHHIHVELGTAISQGECGCFNIRWDGLCFVSHVLNCAIHQLLLPSSSCTKAGSFTSSFCIALHICDRLSLTLLESLPSTPFDQNRTLFIRGIIALHFRV